MMPFDAQQIIQAISVWGIPVLLAITLHEAAHGYVARLNGDSTAWMLGRVTLNPFKHIDIFGTVLLPLVLVVMSLPIIGYAKPVPVNFSKLTRPRLGQILVAAAGPAATLLLVFISIGLTYLALVLPPYWGEFLIEVAWASVQINLLLMVLNMLPILPLDGGRILEALLPGNIGYLYGRTERYGMIIILFLVFTQVLFKIIVPIMALTLYLLSGFFPAEFNIGY